MGRRHFRLHENAARAGAGRAPSGRAHCLRRRASSPVRQKPWLAAARGHRLCGRHGDPREPEADARILLMNNGNAQNTARENFYANLFKAAFA